MGALCVEACSALGAWGEVLGAVALVYAAWQRRQRTVAVSEKKVAEVQRDEAVKQLSLRPQAPVVHFLSVPPLDLTKPFPPQSAVPRGDGGESTDP